MDQQFINEVLNILPTNIGLVEVKQYKISNKKQEMEIFSTIEASQRISIQSPNLIKEMKSKLGALRMPKRMYDKLIDSLFPVYDKGEKIYGLSNLHSYVDGQFQENQKLETLIDFINIIIFWSSDNWESLQLLKDLETRLNIQSLDIQIIAINIDQSFESWEKCMTELQTYNSFYLDKSNNMYEILLKAFQINFLPHVVILSNDQSIHVSGVYTYHQIESIVKDLNNKDNKQEFQQNQEQQVLQNNVQVSKEEFKLMKTLLKQDIIDMMTALISEENYIELKLIKKIKLNVSGKKEGLYRSPLLIEHQIQKDSKEQFEGFLQFLDEIIPEKKYIKVKGSKNQAITNEELTLIDFTNNILSQFQIELNPYIQEEYNYQWKYQNNTFLCEHVIREQVKFNKDVDLKLFHQIKTIIESLELDEKSQEKFQNLLIKLLAPVGLGQRFQNIDGFLNSQGKEVIIEHTQGQMLVLLFLVPCPFIIIKLEQTFQKLKEMYGEKIRLVYLAIDNNEDDIQAIYKYSPEAQFFYPTIDPQIARDKYNASVFPFFVIVDQLGIIRHADLFLNFLDKIDFVYQKYIPTPQQNQEIDLEGLQTFLLHQELITKELGDEFQFEFKIKIQQNEKQEFIAITEYMYRQIESQVVNNMLNQLEQYIPKDKNTLVQKLMKSVNIPYPGGNCTSCFAQLGRNQPQFYNFFQNIFYCVKCAEDEKKNIKDILVFINSPITDLNALKDIDQYRFGKNIQPTGEPDKYNLKHDFNCDGCAKRDCTGSRYIVLNKQKGKLRKGGFNDYCSDCFLLIKNKSPQAKTFKFVDENTIFLRVLYNFGYHNF